MINIDLSIDEVCALHEEFIANNSELAKEKPYLQPLFQWVALHSLEYERNRFESGDKYALMAAIRVCANHDFVLPSWVAEAYINAYDSVNNARSKSWDEAFGRPYKKGAQLAAIRKKQLGTFQVWGEVKLILKKNPEIAIDEALFERVGKEFNIGKTLAGEYYYAGVKFMGY